ncbi:MAG: DUF4430 domain-containing protein [Gaiellaceae bacterium]
MEGRTQTIYARAPRLVDAATPMEALLLAARAGEFHVHVQQSSFGPFVDQVGYYPSSGSSGWVYKVNGASPPVGADQLQLRDGDAVLWYWADFDSTTFAGPKTLMLERTSARCYAAFEQDDAGARTAALGVRVWVGGAAKRGSATGRFCLGAHRGLVHVTKAGAVRSNGIT